jgi:hypothetical protein
LFQVRKMFWLAKTPIPRRRANRATRSFPLDIGGVEANLEVALTAERLNAALRQTQRRTRPA